MDGRRPWNIGNSTLAGFTSTSAANVSFKSNARLRQERRSPIVFKRMFMERAGTIRTTRLNTLAVPLVRLLYMVRQA